ncbi:MAG: hypothetical protein K2X87_31565 [Gemmataceae bacterium]|nr:hypothetical protein [Gemmataceae bacterium]
MRVASVVAVLLLSGSASGVASEPALPPERLAADADVIVVGPVKEVYSRVEDDGRGHVTARLVFAVAVEAVEKGDAVRPGDLVYVRSYQNVRVPADWAGEGGQGAPAVGVRVRAYLRRQGGGYDPLSPNGLVWLDGQTARYAVPSTEGGSVEAGRFWWLAVAGGLGGLVCGILIGRGFRPRRHAEPGAAPDPAPKAGPGR